jgi:hypothetical protein
MTSPGQSDRVQRLIEKYRDAGMSLVDAVRAAQEAAQEEHAQAVAWKGHARSIARSERTMNDTQVDLMCRGEMSRIAHDLRVQEIERQHAGQGAGRGK